MTVGLVSGLGSAVVKVLSRSLAGGVALACLIAAAPASAAPKGELVFLQWLAGSELDRMHAIEAAFIEAYPQVTIKEVPITWSGDPRGGIRTALLGGEKADLVIDTWPAFRKELVEAKLVRPLDDVWTAKKWSDRLDGSWRALGSTGDHVYGLVYNYGDRSGMWYRTDTLKKAGIAAVPANWEQFLADFGKLRAIGVVPYVIPAKFWAHAEAFETLLLRTAGAEASRKLATHAIAWTDEAVKGTLRKWREMLRAGCCGDTATMLGTDWDNAADAVLKNGTGGFVQLGLWINTRAQDAYKLTPGTDYSLLQFPALGLGHDDTASVDAKELLGLTSGRNAEAADAFMDFIINAKGADLIAKAGLPSPSKAVDGTLYTPVIKLSNDIVSKSDIAFVLGDTLPGDLGDEYRVQLQKFLQDTSDANIDAVTAAIEAKAKDVY